MIISHKHRFIFIKTHKTAGTSIEIALSKYCGADDIITPISESDELFKKENGYPSAQNYIIPFKNYSLFDWVKFIITNKKRKYFNHIKADRVKKFVGKQIWNDYYKFCFERDPYDKCISGYYWMNKNNETALSPEDYLLKEAHLFSDFDMYSENDAIIVDDVFKYEDLENSLQIIQKKIGLPNTIDLSQITAKGGVRKKRVAQKELLSASLRKHIAKVFRKEIETFNY